MLFLATTIATTVGCDARVDDKPEKPNKHESIPVRSEDLIATWRAPPEKGTWRESEWGPARIECTFRPDGTFETALTIDPQSPPGGGTVRSTGKYKVSGDTLVSDDFARGEAPKIAIKKGRLIVQFKDGEHYEFAKVK